MEKDALKDTPRLYLYNQILTSTPKTFNINQKMISYSKTKH